MKTYNIEVDGGTAFLFECSVELDPENEETLGYIKEVVDFFTLKDYVKRIGYIDTFLKLVSRKAMYLAIDWNEDAVPRKFAEEEGYYSLDGTYGIRMFNVNLCMPIMDSFEILNNG